MKTTRLRLKRTAQTATLYLLACLLLNTMPISTPTIGFDVEICDNGIDDDNDGLVDLNDEDCDCPVLEVNSLIPNPSFEELNCCPSLESQLNCAVDWIQASTPTTDLLHTCGWMGWLPYPPPLPFPNGESIIGFRNSRVIDVTSQSSNGESSWKEYAGACLLRPMLADSTYRIELYVGFANTQYSPPIELTVYGTSNCDFLPFGEGDWWFGCPSTSPDWTRLAFTNVASASGTSWEQAVVEITPNRSINAIAIGPDCETIVQDTTRYYFLDDLVLAEQDSFKFEVESDQHPCAADFSLSVANDPNVQYQWYKEGIALVGESSAELSPLYGEGEYQVRITSGMDCWLSPPFDYRIPVFEQAVTDVLCTGETYQFGTQNLNSPGDYIETFASNDQCDSTVYLTLMEIDGYEEEVEAKIFPGEVFEGIANSQFSEEGEYDIALSSSQGCDSLIHLTLSYYEVFAPNVFSPNRDGVNDYFRLYGGNDLEEIVDLSVYSRWGNQVYQDRNLLTSIQSGWDGQYQGRLAEAGIYVYYATIRMDDGIERTISGNVLVLR